MILALLYLNQGVTLLDPIVVIITEGLAVVKHVRDKDACLDDALKRQIRIDKVGICLKYHYDYAYYDDDTWGDKL